MSERLRPSDLALLAEETPRTPMHNATLEIFDPGDSGFDYDSLLAHIDDRLVGGRFYGAVRLAAACGGRKFERWLLHRRGPRMTPKYTSEYDAMQPKGAARQAVI